MDTTRISFGEMVAGAAAAALFVIMFLPWYDGEASAELGGQNFSVDADSANAWQVFSFIDILLFIIIVLAVGMVVARAAGAMPANLPAPPGLIVAAAGALAVVLILFRLVVTPGPEVEVSGVEVDVTRKIGIFLGLIAAAAMTYGGYTALNERGSGAAPSAGTAPPPSPPPPSPPPPSSQPPAV